MKAGKGMDKNTMKVISMPARQPQPALAYWKTLLDRSVEELELTTRSYNCLKKTRIQSVGELVQKTEAEMLSICTFGPKSLNEIKEVLTNLGLSLNMQIDALDHLVAPPSGDVDEGAIPIGRKEIRGQTSRIMSPIDRKQDIYQVFRYARGVNSLDSNFWVDVMAYAYRQGRRHKVFPVPSAWQYSYSGGFENLRREWPEEFPLEHKRGAARRHRPTWGAAKG